MRHDLDLLQGSWTITALEVEGRQMPGDTFAGSHISIKGDRFTSSGMGAAYEGTLRLDVSAKPRRLDMLFDAGPEKGNTNPGIYELDGDTWQICLATRGSVRPSSFASTPGSGFALETLTRGAAPATEARAEKQSAREASENAEAGAFEGEWRLVSAIMDGRPMEESAVQWVRRVTEGNQTTVYAGPQVMLKVEFTCDPSKSPKSVDYLCLAGANKGKKQLAIYEFEGGMLKFCVAAPGAPRPSQFQSLPGDGGTLTVWAR